MNSEQSVSLMEEVVGCGLWVGWFAQESCVLGLPAVRSFLPLGTEIEGPPYLQGTQGPAESTRNAVNTAPPQLGALSQGLLSTPHL